MFDRDMPAKLETEKGTLYRPQHLGIQFLILIACFAGGTQIGRIIAIILGDLSENARIFLYLPFPAILFFGYSIWIARLNALAFELLGRGILTVIFILIFRRKKPESIQEVLPSEDKFIEMVVRAQKAASSFLLASFPVAIAAGLLAMFIDSGSSVFLQATLVAGSCILWGMALKYLGQRGYLPILEED